MLSPRLPGGPRQHLQHQRRPRVRQPALAGAPALPPAPGRLLLRHRAVRRVVDRPRPLRRRRRYRQVPRQECPSNCRSVIVYKICLAASCLARRRQDSEASQRGRALHAEQLARDIASMLHAGRLTFQLMGMPSAQAVGRAAAGQPDHDSAAQHPQAAAGALRPRRLTSGCQPVLALHLHSERPCDARVRCEAMHATLSSRCCRWSQSRPPILRLALVHRRRAAPTSTSSVSA